MLRAKNIIKPLFLSAFLGFACTILLSSCNDSFIYEEEGDCSLHYKLNFRYDMNLKWADAFSSEVKSVRVYVFDEAERLVKDYIYSGSALSEPGFSIDLDLPAGNYHLIGWCGIDNEDVEEQSFSAPLSSGMDLQQLYCRLNWSSTPRYEALSDKHLQFMYYGNIDITIEDENEEGGTVYYTMPLVKDTNHIRVELVQLSGDPTEVNDFTFTIEDADGVMDWNNNLTGNPIITYTPWHTANDIMELEMSGGTTNTICAVADMDVSRMTVEQENNMRLKIRNEKTGAIVASVPVIQYALLAKGYYEYAYNHVMTDQEFLDREDEYRLTFFLDKDMKWISSYLFINSWRVLINGYDL